LQASEEEKFAFVVEWYDPLAALVRQYMLYYHDHDSTIEMVFVINCCLLVGKAFVH